MTIDIEEMQKIIDDQKAEIDRIKDIFINMSKNVKPCIECKNKIPGLSCGLPGTEIGKPVPCTWVNGNCIPDLPDRFEQKEPDDEIKLLREKMEKIVTFLDDQAKRQYLYFANSVCGKIKEIIEDS